MAWATTFRLKHPRADLAFIAKEIDFPVARIWTVGAQRQTVDKIALKGIYDCSYLAFKVYTQEGTVAAAVTRVDLALSKATNIHSFVMAPELEKELYCTLLDGGETLECKSMARLLVWGIRLGIDAG